MHLWQNKGWKIPLNLLSYRSNYKAFSIYLQFAWLWKKNIYHNMHGHPCCTNATCWATGGIPRYWVNRLLTWHQNFISKQGAFNNFWLGLTNRKHMDFGNKIILSSCLEEFKEHNGPVHSIFHWAGQWVAKDIDWTPYKRPYGPGSLALWERGTQVKLVWVMPACLWGWVQSGTDWGTGR